MTDDFYLDKLGPSDFGILRNMIGDLDYPWFYGKQASSASFQYVAAAVVFNRRGLGTLFNAIRHSQTKALIGCVVLLPEFKNKEVAEIGYFIHPDHRSKGIVSRAAKQIVKKAIESGWLKQLVATTHPDNLHSHRILEKLGLQVVTLSETSNYFERDGKTPAKRLHFIADIQAIKNAIYKPDTPGHQSTINPDPLIP